MVKLMSKCIVIGAGPGGMSAAIYLKRAGIDVILIEKMVPGGEMLKTNKIENYLGFDSIDGGELALRMSSQVKDLGIEIVAVAADNGDIGGKNSEEIMALSRIGEDTILYNSETKQGLNIEVLEKEDAKEHLKEIYGIDSIESFHKEKALELGHIFALGTKYSQTMNINYIDNENNSKPFYMGCYGIGVSRVLGLVYENNIIEENGKVVGYSLPISVTPYYIYIISSDKNKERAEELYTILNNKNIDVIIDDVKGSIGEKIRNAKILGIPYVAILGNNTPEDSIEVEKTKNGDKKIFDLDTFIEELEKMKNTKCELID